MKHTDKPTTTASASQNCEHVTTKYVDQCDTCGQYISPDKRTIPAEKPTDAPNYYADAMVEDLAATHARLLTQAAQLAEALRDALKYADSATEHPENKAAFKRIVAKALAAYEEGK